MFLMHTKLPEFIRKMKLSAAKGGKIPKEIKIEGIENLKFAKLQSLRTGRLELAVEELAGRDDVERIELLVRPRVPETEHTVIVKGYNKDGVAVKAIMDTMTILHGTEELDLFDALEIEDRRARIGQQS